MGKKIDVKKIVEDTGQNTKEILEKTKKVVSNTIDQNDDGKFNKDDVVVIVNKTEDYIKQAKINIKETKDQKSREAELKRLRPIFVEDLNSPDFNIQKLIRVLDIDNKRKESEVCKNSIGFYSKENEVSVTNVFTDKILDFGVSLYPNNEKQIYYVDPYDKNKYIALENYFEYLKVARINELENIAQELGAKHFRVSIKEKNTSIMSRKVSANAKIKSASKKSGGTANADYNYNKIDNSDVKIVSESDYVGHEPVMPTLMYLKKEPTVQRLIASRMSQNASLHRKVEIKFSNTTGINERIAADIDGAVKSMKLNAYTNIESEAKSEKLKYFEYEIDF